MKYLLLCYSVCLSMLVNAQVSIVFPHNRQVFQRNAQNEAIISILGNCPQDVSQVQYKLEPVKMGQGTTINWTNISAKPVSGFYQEKVTVKGGWYTLKIRTYQGNQLKDSTQLDRVGVGENFIISGQSNAQGGNNRHAEESFSKDDRVNVANIYNYYKDYNSSPFYRYLGQLNTDFPFTDFQHLDAKTTIGPMGLSNYYWARLGDRLAETYNVPVCFINTAWLATAMRNWYESSLPNPKPSANPFDSNFYYDAGFPFKNLKRAVELFGKKNGVRAILWHQGETDSYNNRTASNELRKAQADTYQQNFKDLIKNLRSQTGVDVPWLVSQVSYYSGLQANGTCIPAYTDNLLLSKQGNMVTEVSGISEIYLGPYTDVVEVPRKTDAFADCVHFSPDAYEELAYLWLEKITAAIGKNAKAVTPKALPSFSVICDNTNATNLSVSTSDSIQWLNGSAQVLSKASTIQKATSGNYSMRLQDGVGNEFTVPTFQFMPLQAPATPIIVVKGDTLFCQGSAVELQVANPDLTYIWNTGAQTSLITVKDKGAFQVKGTDPYQCTTAYSKAVTTQVFDVPAAPSISQESPYFLKTSILKASDTNLFWEYNQNVLTEKGTLLRVKESGTYSLYLTKSYAPGPTCVSPKATYSYSLPDDMGVVIFPNPVANSLSIQARTSLAGALVKIYTMDGRLVLDSQISQDGSAQLNVQHLSQGSYKLWVRTNDQLEYVKNIIVSH
ncbi:sialate O-acetylesterase [Aquirufa nivalisilvae]|uniref:sialate O-acetylesterase n=1 Tax=Aquirufa nivalisilvae TaxID=2516557 RepID=UPI0022A8E41E|nr:sialate O-acetylesterase [Aquirufa nivalisilvae]MCZ2479246.1 T9SS type A sorting domain-containing protein [Aquirufa nivalisilvae]